MKIIALEQELPNATAKQFHLLAKDEARAAWNLYKSGSIREMYFRADQHTAVLVLECETTSEAAALLAGLPFVRAGLITFELVPLQAYDGFARLFDQEQSDAEE
jgi:hypothetical protein